MARQRTAHSYELELKKMIALRTGAAFEPWLLPQIRVTASNMVMIDKVQDELTDEDSLVSTLEGSTGQFKNEVNPLLPYYLKLQAELRLQFEALGLNFRLQPSKIKEDARKGVDAEKDGLASMLKDARENMNNEIPDIE